jgi:hypothetical protein
MPKVGEKHGKLTFVKLAPKTMDYKAERVVTRCDCGAEDLYELDLRNWRAGVKSCPECRVHRGASKGT